MTAAGDVVIRPLAGHDELRRCVDLQRRIWGSDFAELVPPAILWIASRTGGIAAAAFDPRDRMLGFLFGLSGWVDGRPVHWSDMLAVDPAARGRGIGTALKRYQRDTLLARGIATVGWTFEPLESRNAWLNFAHLGITSREYIRDCYGKSDSPLHHGLGTDRLVAHWALDSPRVRQRMERPATASAAAGTAAAAGDAPLAVDGAADPRLDLTAPRLRVRVPADIQTLKQRDPRAALLWREHTRAAFETYFARGYRAVELIRETPAASSYLLERNGD